MRGLTFWRSNRVTGALTNALVISASSIPLSRSSPHLVQVRERIRINGQPVGKELFSKYFWQVYGRLEKTKVGDFSSVVR